jgi:tetratricopeptide (TPR) repeat protein
VEEAIPSLRLLLDTAEESPMMTGLLRLLEVLLLRYRGKLTEGIEGLRSLRTSARASGNLQGLAQVDEELASAFIWEGIGEEEELEAILQESLDLDRRVMGRAVLTRCLLSVRHARQGEPEGARRFLADAHEQAAGQGESVLWEPYLSWTEAHLAVSEARWPEALAAFETAVDALGQRKLRWRRARTLVDWAETYLNRGKSGDRECAEELLREAEAEFEAMGAHGYVERVRGRLEELGAG